jgi:putative nucleotidyltransferase with HDIG domain
MKLLFENWRKFLKENTEEVIQAEEEVIDQLLKTSELFRTAWDEMEASIEGTSHHHGETSGQHTRNVMAAMEGVIEDLADTIDDATRRKYRLMAVLHDIGKPATRAEEEGGRVRFFGHAGVGAEMTKDILEEIGESDVDVMVNLVKMHMDVLERINLLKKDELSDKAVRKFARKAGDQLEMLANFSKANIRSLIDPDVVPETRGEAWEEFKEEQLASIDLIDQLVSRVRAETEKQETQKAVETPVDFAKGLASRGLPAEQIKNIIMKKYGKPEQAALGIMRGAGIE